VAEICANYLHTAWLQAVDLALHSRKHEVCPLTVTITKQAGVEDWDDLRFRQDLNGLLASASRQPVENVASTIFMRSLWHESLSSQKFYERYLKVLPKLRHFAQNRRGIYLERLIDYPGDQNGKGLNQLNEIIKYFKGGTRRRSAFQATTYVPIKDLSGAPYLHFPCLQQVAFLPSVDGTLTIMAFYPLHYLFERAYGNYLGLVYLGEFMAHEMSLRLGRVICVAGAAKLENSTAKVLRPFVKESRRYVASSDT
jgi:thymidylate synthase